MTTLQLLTIILAALLLQLAAGIVVPAVLIAGGIGITPMMSMLRWGTAEQHARRVVVGYGCYELTLANTQREHEKEGIADFDNRVTCHRSASGDREGRGSEGGKGHEGRKRD